MMSDDFDDTDGYYDDIEIDFEPAPVADMIRNRLGRGESRSTIAETLSMSLADVNTVIATAAREASGEAGTPVERAWVARATLDELQDHAFGALIASREDKAPLLAVLVDITEARARLTSRRR